MPTFDPNVMRSLRLNNIFQPQEPQFQMPQAPADDGTMSFAMPPRDSSIDLESYQPKTDMMDRMTGMVNHMPERESPSLGRRIGGILAMLSGGGLGAYENITQKPYHDKMNTFTDQFEPTSKAAQIENNQNTNMRMLANQVATDRRGRETIDLNAKKADAKIENDAKRIAIADARSKAYLYKQTHPDHKMVQDKDGSIYFVNPQDPTQKVNTGLNSGDLDDVDKAMLAHENKMGEIREGGNQSRLTEDVRQGGRETLKDQGAWDIATVTGDDGKTRSVRINKNTGEIKELNVKGTITKQGTDKTGSAASSSKAVAGETPQQYKVRVFNDAQKAAREHPEWAKFIKAKPDGTVVITKPSDQGGWFSSGPSNEMYKQITSHIGIDAKTGSTVGDSKDTSTDDRITVSKVDSKTGKLEKFSVPKSQKTQAESEGYKVE